VAILRCEVHERVSKSIRLIDISSEFLQVSYSIQVIISSNRYEQGRTAIVSCLVDVGSKVFGKKLQHI
jgi:uncharacterized protein (DUF952 family)